MTPATLLANATTLIEGNPDAAGLLDRCTIYRRDFSVGASGGSTYTDTQVATGVACLYEERTFKSGSNQADSLTADVTHRLFLIADATTRAIRPNHVIVVASRGDTPALTFNTVVRLDESLGPLVIVGATLKV